MLIGIGYAALEATAEAVLGPLLRTKKERQALREEKARKERLRRDTELSGNRPAEVFDGDWQAESGQFLLRWYGRSSHPSRLVVLGPDRIVLAGPPRRVTLGQGKKAQILDVLKADRAIVEDPARGRFSTGRLRIPQPRVTFDSGLAPVTSRCSRRGCGPRGRWRGRGPVRARP
ncbi:hypothetical protein [Streptomyces sp. URMC 124]|uniref:hypothetical protein n=1 Tax=Streptomyces sp. URMC 124 TaxID=3423405 RepID=UPI003F1DF02C